MAQPQRTFDYFLIIGPPPPTDTSESSDLPPEHRNPSLVRALTTINPPIPTPIILDRYPPIDYKDAPFPKDAPLFCFPLGINAHMMKAEYNAGETEFHSFVLTESDGRKIYCSCLNFYESSQFSSQYSSTPHVIKALVITSHWPFFIQPMLFLRFLISTITHSNGTHNELSLEIPVERMISHFMSEIPLPPRGLIEIAYTLPAGGKRGTLNFKRSPPNQLATLSLNYQNLFHMLSVDNILQVFSAVLCEKRILFISSSLFALTEVIETLIYLIFPFYWRHVYIPVLPKGLIDFVCAPMPFIAGIHESYLPDPIMLEGVIQVDLSRNQIKSDLKGDAKIHALPDKPGARLAKGLRKIMTDTSTPLEVSEQNSKILNSNWNQILTLFNQFFAEFLAQYKDYLEPPSDFVIDKFNKQKFLKDSSGKSQEFITDFLETQLFQCFVDERYSSFESDLANVSAGNNKKLECLLFDERIDQFLGKSTPFITDTTNLHKEIHTVLAPSCKDSGIPEKRYRYGFWPKNLDPALFGQFNPPPLLFRRADDPQTALPESADESESTPLNISLAMRYFSDKSTYSRHFHSLRIRSSKQDVAFRSMVKLMEGMSHYLSSATYEMNAILSDLQENDVMSSPNTGTSVDTAILGIQSQVTSEVLYFTSILPLFEKNILLPLHEKYTEVEKLLSILFEEAKDLDRKASIGKSSVDKERTRYSKTIAKLHFIQEKKLYYASDITKRITIESEAENCFLRKIEAEVSFRSIHSVYEKRMPDIIEHIRKLNVERIRVLKNLLLSYSSMRIGALTSLTTSFQEVLEQNFNAINEENDLNVFSEGKLDFLQLMSDDIERAMPVETRREEMKTTDLPPVGDLIQKNDDGAVEVSEEKQEFFGKSYTRGVGNSVARGKFSLLPEGMTARGDPALIRSQLELHIREPSRTRSPVPVPSASDPPPERSLVQSEEIVYEKEDSTKLIRRLRNSFSGIHVSYYCLDLWGAKGFDLSYAQAEQSKVFIKAFFIALENWAGIFESKSKNLSKLYRSLCVSTNTNGVTTYSLLRSVMLENSTLFQYWGLVVVYIQKRSGWNRTIFECLKLLSVALKILKGIVKRSYLRLAEHRSEISEELYQANEDLLRANEKYEKAKREFEKCKQETNAQRSQEQTRLSGRSRTLLNDRVDRLKGDLKQAENDTIVLRRNQMTVKEKHDICLAQYLQLFQNRETQKIKETKSALRQVSNLLITLTANLKKEHEDVLKHIDALDLKKDFALFINYTMRRDNLPVPEIVSEAISDPGENSGDDIVCIDLTKCFGNIEDREVQGYAFRVSVKFLENMGLYMKNLCILIESYISIEESVGKAYTRNFSSFIISNKADKETSLYKAVMRWGVLIEGLMSSGNALSGDIKEKCHAPLWRVSKSFKGEINAYTKRYSDVLKSIATAESSHAKARAEFIKAEGVLENAVDKVVKEENDPKSGLISSLLTASLEKLKAKVESAKVNQHKCKKTLESEKDNLNKMYRMETRSMQDILTNINQFATAGFTTMRNIVKTLNTLKRYGTGINRADA